MIRSRPHWPRETPSFYPAYEQLSYSSPEHSEPMPTADPDEHRDASEPPPARDSTAETSSGNSRPLTGEEQSGLIEDARRFMESHEKSFRLLVREGVSREGGSPKNTTNEDQ